MLMKYNSCYLLNITCPFLKMTGEKSFFAKLTIYQPPCVIHGSLILTCKLNVKTMKQ